MTVKNMKPTRLLLALAAVGFCTALTGCGSLSVGEEEFACSGMPGSSYCHSARDVYETSEQGIVPSPMRKDTRNEDCADCVYSEDVNPELQAMKGTGEAQGRVVAVRGTGPDGQAVVLVDPTMSSTGKTLQVTGDEVINNYVTPALPTDPVPIRTPAQIMRIWVAPYVDTNGDLVAPGIVYTEIEPRRWIYPDNENGHNRVFAPLQATGSWSTKPSKNPGARDGESYLELFNQGKLGTQK